MLLTILRIQKSATTTAPINSVCPECGILKRSGRASCCAPGGSWFGKCGSVANVNLGHTWNEGIRACKTGKEAVIGQQLHASKPKSNVSDPGSMGVDSQTQIAAAHIASRKTPVVTPPMNAAETAILDASANVSTSQQIMPPSNGNTRLMHGLSTGETTSTQASAGMPITARGYENLLNVVTRISMILIIVY